MTLNSYLNYLISQSYKQSLQLSFDLERLKIFTFINNKVIFLKKIILHNL